MKFLLNNKRNNENKNNKFIELESSLQDSILREKMGEAGRSMVEEKYSLDKYFSKLQTLLTIQ